MDTTTILALIAALGGSAGLAALLKAIIDGRNTAKQHDLDVLREVVNQLQEENARLRTRMLDLEQKNKWLERENHVLRQALTKAGIDVPEFTVTD